MASGSHLITPRQLLILQYMAGRITPRHPEGWTKADRIERECSFASISPDNKTLAVHEQIFGSDDGLASLTAPRKPGVDPFLILHKSGVHLRISQNGMRLAQSCTIGRFTRQDGRHEFIVIDAATRKPPVIDTSDSPVDVSDYEGDDDVDDTLPSTVVDLDAPAPAEAAVDDDPPNPQHDEINAEPRSDPGLSMQTGRARRKTTA